jgi:hypothetical protein
MSWLDVVMFHKGSPSIGAPAVMETNAAIDVVQWKGTRDVMVNNVNILMLKFVV